MFTLSLNATVPPIPVTAVVVDLRNFTPHLIASKEDNQGVSGFCHFLTKFYGLCLESCLVALPPSLRYQPPLYMSSTGDGVLMVFFDQFHYAQAFLAGQIMHIHLKRYCDSYNKVLTDPAVPRTSFGLGMESGSASRLRALSQNPTMHPIIDTYIGNCINIASRAQDITKTLYRAKSIIGPRLNELLGQELFQQSYEALETEAKNPKLNEPERFSLYNQMDGLNRKLCLQYIHHHLLKGIAKPVPLFRFSDRSITLDNPRFQTLLKALVRGAETHQHEVAGFLQDPMTR